MDLAPIQWHQLPMVLSVLAATLAVSVGLLMLALPRRTAWAARGGDQSQYRETIPNERRKVRRPPGSAWARHALP